MGVSLTNNKIREEQMDNFDVITTAQIKEPADIDKLLQEHLHISLQDCYQALSESLKNRAEELLIDMINLAPYGDYNALMEEPQEMLTFLIEEAAKPENWEVQFVDVKKQDDQLLEVMCFNSSIDDGDILKGFLFIGLTGKIRHCFPQIHN